MNAAGWVSCIAAVIVVACLIYAATAPWSWQWGDDEPSDDEWES
jgi:hypothetical protein